MRSLARSHGKMSSHSVHPKLFGRRFGIRVRASTESYASVPSRANFNRVLSTGASRESTSASNTSGSSVMRRPRSGSSSVMGDVEREGGPRPIVARARACARRLLREERGS